MKFTVEEPATLEVFLRGRQVSRRLLTKLKAREGGILRNGEPIRSIDSVLRGDVITLNPCDESLIVPNGDLSADVVFENDSVAVFNKPANMPVHPSHNHQEDTLGNLFAALYPGTAFRPINRLDRDTSGLCVVAMNAYSACVLHNKVSKTYWAAVEGQACAFGTVDAPIARQNESIILRQVSPGGKRAVTHYVSERYSGTHTLVRVRLETGRTHQIRVHFAHIGMPLAGDDLYGGSRDVISRQALHCGTVRFPDPVTGTEIQLDIGVADDILRIFETMPSG